MLGRGESPMLRILAKHALAGASDQSQEHGYVSALSRVKFSFKVAINDFILLIYCKSQRKSRTAGIKRTCAKNMLTFHRQFAAMPTADEARSHHSRVGRLSSAARVLLRALSSGRNY